MSSAVPSENPRRRRGNAACLSPRGLPISREELLAILTTCTSLRAAAEKLSRRFGRPFNHQTLMDVLIYDDFFKALVENAEQRYAELWPKSATDPDLLDYGWLHTLLNRRARTLLATLRWQATPEQLETRRTLEAQLKTQHTTRRNLPSNPRDRHNTSAEDIQDALNKKLDELDLQIWPPCDVLCDLFRNTYPEDRWLPLTERRKLLLKAGLPGPLRESIFRALSSPLPPRHGGRAGSTRA